METPLEKISLETLGEGVVEEIFGREFVKVLENVLDINTEAKKKRTITLKFTFEPNEDRNMMRIWVDPGSTLAPQTGYASQAFIGREDGVAVAKEHKKKTMPALFKKDDRFTRVK